MGKLLNYLRSILNHEADYPITLDFRPDLPVGRALLDNVAIAALESGRYGVTIAIIVDNNGKTRLMGFGVVPLARLPQELEAMQRGPVDEARS